MTTNPTTITLQPAAKTRPVRRSLVTAATVAALSATAVLGWQVVGHNNEPAHYMGPAAPFTGGVEIPRYQGPAAPFTGGVEIPRYQGPAAPFTGLPDLAKLGMVVDGH
jgi:hypothetical protein